MSRLLFPLALGAFALANVQYLDRNCGGDLSNLWLDVVVVVDNSKQMSTHTLYDISNEIARVFESGTRIGVQDNEPRTTRVGLITYNENAYLAADLNQFQSIDDLYDGVFRHLSAVSAFEDSFLTNGLLLAEQVLNKGNQNANRVHYQKVIIVYSSTIVTGPGDMNPFTVSNRLIADGVTIITVSYGTDSTVSEDFQRIASPFRSFAKASVPGSLLEAVQGSLLQANCFCPNGWTQYRSSFANTYSHRFGVCIQAFEQSTAWNTARIACRNRWQNSYLVNEYNQAKHNFVFSIVRNTTGINQPYNYHIGMSLSKGQWSWEQPVSQALIPLQDYSPWNQGAPITSSVLTGVMNQQKTGEMVTGWENVNSMSTYANYVCQVASCDTDNYCATVDD